MDELFDGVPTRAMAVFAHPADAEIACGATLAAWAAAGCSIGLVVCTQGDKGSHRRDVAAAEVAATRTTEVAAGAAALGLGAHEMLGHLDGEVTNSSDLRAELVARIRAWRPEVVFGHDPTAVFIGSGYVNHRDHREVGFALLDAVAPAAASPLYYPDAGPPHQVAQLLLSGTLEADTWIDVRGHLDRKVTALRCHASQVGPEADGVELVVRGRAGEGTSRTGIDQTEAFRRVALG